MTFGLSPCSLAVCPRRPPVVLTASAGRVYIVGCWGSSGFLSWVVHPAFSVLFRGLGLNLVYQPGKFSMSLVCVSFSVLEPGYFSVCACEPSHFVHGTCVGCVVSDMNCVGVFDTQWFFGPLLLGYLSLHRFPV